jgi:transcriptional regulator with XRE-family HTH domain
MKPHWTARSIKDYLFRIASDFIAQLESKMDSLPISQDELAKKLGVTKGRVSQLINHPGNISLATMIEYAKAVGMKVSVVAYEDNDPKNTKGPIDSEIFRICWEQLGKPRDFWDAQGILTTKNVSAANVTFGRRIEDFKIFDARRSSSGNVAACPPFFSIESFAGNQKTFENDKPLPS